MIATTLDNWSKDVHNSIIDNNGLLFYFKSFGKMGALGKSGKKMGSIETRTGGTQITEDVSLLDNPNVAFVAYDETVPIVEQDALATAVYQWKFCYGNAPISKAKIDLNSGTKWQKHQLVENIVNVAEASMINVIGTGMWNTADADAIDGIPELITDDGTTTTVGGLSTTTYPNWANKFENMAADASGAVLIAAMSSLYRKCTRGSSTPDLIVMGATLYGTYEAALTPNKRFTNDKMADAGFQNLKYNGATVIYDENCPVKRAYFINTKSMGFYFHNKDMFSVGEKEKGYGKMQFNFPISSTCNLILKNRRDQGVLVEAVS